MEQQENKKPASQTAAAVSSKKMGRPFRIVEAYKALRTNLLFSLATTDRKVVILSSPEPHAGKSTTAANLAIVMAQTNFKVLLIDADMRKPSLDHIFRVGRSDGLSKVLSRLSSIETAISRQVTPNLDFLSAGPIPPNPQELLCSDAMKQLLCETEDAYDYLFIDTPPVNLVADAMMLLKDTAGMLLIAREGKTTHEDLRTAEDAVAQIDGQILGIVLTDVRQHNGIRREKYYKYNDYEYGK